VALGISITLRAMPDPAGASFAAGQPVWKILTGAGAILRPLTAGRLR